MKNSFSLIEIIFTITIISIISIVAIPKLFFNVDNANIVKLRSDVALIRNGINKYKNKQLFSNETVTLDSLGNSDSLLFNTILTQPIVAKENIGGNWSKQSTNSYKAWISNYKYVEFAYSSDNLTFDCDFNDEYCEDLTQ